jgi:hypothetical protein
VSLATELLLEGNCGVGGSSLGCPPISTQTSMCLRQVAERRGLRRI